MNKEIEEAKKYFDIKKSNAFVSRQERKYYNDILNYIQELEENKGYYEESGGIKNDYSK